MKTINDKFQQMLANVPQDITTEIDLSFAIATEIEHLMKERGLPKSSLPMLSARTPVK